MKKKRVSKRNKIAWRKHVNIDDVEDFLEDQRLEERLGLKSDVSDQQLFTLDKTPSTDVSKLSKKEKCRLKLANPRCFQILKPHTNVPDPISKRNRVRTKEERKSKLVKLKEEDRRIKGILKAKEVDSIKGKELYEKKKLQLPKRGEFLKDVWEVQTNVTKLNEWVNEDVTTHNLRQTGVYLKKVVPSINKKPTVLQTIEPPHPGVSYNPSFEDHQNLLKEIANKEQELIKRDQHLNRVTKHIFKKVATGTRDKSWLIEMSQGLPFQNNLNKNVNEELNETDDEYKSINPPVENRKKTLKQRRKQKEQLLAERKKRRAKIEKKKVSDLHKLNLLKEQANLLDKKFSLNKQKREKNAEVKKKLTKRLGARKFEEKDLEFNMPGDITGNLRGVKKESNLLVDRFLSLQKRNVIPPSARIQAKKAKFKRYIKPGHKDDWKSTIAGIETPQIKKNN